MLLILFQMATNLAPVEFDLGKMPVAASRPCSAGSAGGGEIVVCARKRDQDKVAVALVAAEGLPKADLRLFGNVRGRVAGQQGNFGGFTSNRAMATVAVPF